MTKKYTKLIVALLSLLVALSAVIVTTYAWVTLSSNPTAEGIQVAIGGGGTILIAPDMTEQVDGVTYHYPGVFQDQINFTQWQNYDYLQNLAGLSPVSTADGRNWFIPTYYSAQDPEVIAGEAAMGQIKPTGQYIKDSALFYANLPVSQLEKAREGCYVYLDFWVVSPGGDYQLRVSAGDNFDHTGSFLLGLPRVEKTADGYHLHYGSDRVAASARIGFLTNTGTVLDDSMQYYARSAYYSNQYTYLRGYYEEPGMAYNDMPGDRFTIYEPNGDLHPETVYNSLGDEILDGQYAFTKPVGKDGKPVSVRDRLTVQLRNRWLENEYGLALEPLFQASIAGETIGNGEEKALERDFYFRYLQQQTSNYLSRGRFLPSTGMLYDMDNVAVSAEQLQSLGTAGATNDVMIVELEKNIPQRIRMFIWLEGQDPDCIGFADSIPFAIGLELAGGRA